MKRIHVIALLTGLGLAAAPLLWAGTAAADGGKKSDRNRNDSASGGFRASLNGAQEVTTPPGGVDSDGRGRGSLSFAGSLASAEVELEVEDLVDVVGPHIHCGGAGENGPIIVDLGVTESGDVDDEIVDTRIENADIAVADCVPLLGFPVNNIASLKRAADAGLLYMNVHTAAFVDGEIRGQLGAP